MKPERIQEQSVADFADTELQPERIQALLRQIPGWEVNDRATVLTRSYLTPNSVAASHFVSFVMAAAETHLRPRIDVTISMDELTLSVTIKGEDRRYLQESDFLLARVIDMREDL